MLLFYIQEGILIRPSQKKLSRKNTFIKKVGFHFGNRTTWGFPLLFHCYVLYILSYNILKNQNYSLWYGLRETRQACDLREKGLLCCFDSG